jgi:hypothetical protein
VKAMIDAVRRISSRSAARRGGRRGWWAAVALGAALSLVAGRGRAIELIGAPEIDDAAIAKLSALYGINATVVAHVDLTKPFNTRATRTAIHSR